MFTSTAAKAAKSKTTHTVTFESDPETSISQFHIHDANGNAAWSGIALYGPLETRTGRWSGLSLKSLSAIIQKLWLIDKINADRIEKDAVHLSLNIDAQYELPLDTDKYRLTDHSELHVMVWRNEVEDNEQKDGNSRISPATGRTTADSVWMGQNPPAHLVGGTCSTESAGIAQSG